MMAEATTTAAVCVATGAVVTPFCAAFGFDPMLLMGGMVGGIAGFVIFQTLLPSKEPISPLRLVLLSIGSVLLSTLGTLLVAPTMVRTFNLEGVPPGAVRLAVGAVIGGCAQVIAAKIRKRVEDAGPATKESGNA
jgi:hypothetical protein